MGIHFLRFSYSKLNYSDQNSISSRFARKLLRLAMGHHVRPLDLELHQLNLKLENKSMESIIYAQFCFYLKNYQSDHNGLLGADNSSNLLGRNYR